MDVYSIITDQITKELEKGVIPWRKPWESGQFKPANAITLKPYRGINPFLLASRGYKSPYWLTYKQANAVGGHIKRGESSTIIVFWKFEVIEPEKPEDERRTRAILRYYRVFNIEQAELPEKFLAKLPKPSDRMVEPIAAAQAIVQGYKNAPPIGTGNAAYYLPREDRIVVPAIEQFPKKEEYYSTLFHEMGHSTGHKDRLGRKGVMEAIRFGSDDYSKEELVAEMTAAFLSGEAGIAPRTIENSAAYIGSWLKVLKNDRRMVVMAAAQAQKAADYVLDRKPETKPEEPEALAA